MNIETPKNFTPYRARSLARLAAVQVMYQWEKNHEPVEMILQQFTVGRAQTLGDETGEVTLAPADVEYLKRLVGIASSRLDHIDPMIAACLVSGWTLDRMESVIKAILRVGCGEILEETSLDGAVIINEYIDIAHAFYGEKEVKFVNTVLDKVYKDVRK